MSDDIDPEFEEDVFAEDLPKGLRVITALDDLTFRSETGTVTKTQLASRAEIDDVDELDMILNFLTESGIARQRENGEFELNPAYHWFITTNKLHEQLTLTELAHETEKRRESFQTQEEYEDRINVHQEYRSYKSALEVYEHFEEMKNSD